MEDLETLSRLNSYLLNDEFEFAAFDTETTGTHKDAEIIGFSVCTEEFLGIYVVLAHWEPEFTEQTCDVCNGMEPPVLLTKAGKPRKHKVCKGCDDARTVKVQGGRLLYNKELKEASQVTLEILKKKKLIMQNAIFDCEVIDREFGIQLMDSVHTDTMVLSHILDENSLIALKERGAKLFGDDYAHEEQEIMQASVEANGGIWNNDTKEMFKADKKHVARYGAKDTILTLKVFLQQITDLFDQALDAFFYDDECMPLLRGPTYDMNTTGMRVDIPKLKALGVELETECVRLTREIEDLVRPLIDDTWPFMKGTKRAEFLVTSNHQIAWLLFTKCGEYFTTLTDSGKVISKSLIGKVPYDFSNKRALIHAMLDQGHKPWKYQQTDADTLEKFQDKYEWVKKLLELRGVAKLLSTYVQPIIEKSRYSIIHPSFLQCGTKTGRYSSNKPNFQNLPRDDKRIKACIVSRPGRVFVGADYSQLEPRVFASVSQDPDLMACFAKGEDFYSVVGAPIFGITGVSMIKDDPNSFAKLYPEYRQISKAFSLATPYGTSAFQQAQKLGMPQKRCQEIIDNYLNRYSSVHQMMLDSHEMVKETGVVYNLYGRPRRLPEGLDIVRMYGNSAHGDLPYDARNILNSAMNFRVQGSAGSIVNRAMIAFYKECKQLGLDAKIILQVHDEIVVECRIEDADRVASILKRCMEETTVLPGVQLIAEPNIAYNLADLK